jgi:hypothetical protein
MCLDETVKIAQIVSYLFGAIAALLAFFVYWANSRRERARWAESLYEKFFERPELKVVRDLLDCEGDDQEVRDLVGAGEYDFTDYLNFFEFVAYLQKSRQLSAADVKALFEYYLQCLKKHTVVMEYIGDKANGYEYLNELLGANR